MNLLSGNRLLGRQTSPKSKINSVVRESCLFRPLLNGLRFSINRHVSGVSFVSCLICSSSPLAVFWTVTKVVVNSFQGKTLRFFTHVGQKVFKFQPSFAHSNSPCPGIFIGLIAFAKAPFFHAFPNGVGWRVFPSHSMPV